MNKGLNVTHPNEVKVPAILIDLIPQYLENRRREIDALTLAVKDRDFETIRNIGHKLKGNAGSYGFAQLTALGCVLEKAGQEEDIKTAQESLSAYDHYLYNVFVIPT